MQNKAKYITLSITIIINLLVLINGFLHNPAVGYDAQDHLSYITVLPDRLPATIKDTGEFYSPPLPYFLPSLGNRICVSLNQTLDCEFINGKVAQFINFLLSIGITLLFLKLADLLKPGDEYFKISLLAFWGILTVYYKTFSQVRGEPYLAFFTVLTAYWMLRILKSPEKIWWKQAVALGFSIGGLILSRQLGFFLLPSIVGIAVIAVIKDRLGSWMLIKISLAGLAIASIVGGWFYMREYLVYGTFTPYSLPKKSFSFSNEPLSFYKNIGLRNFALFTKPTRTTFDNQFIPTFYSDTWGDYWGYWVFLRDKPYKIWPPAGNRDQINPVLGRVNLVSLIPTALFFGGLILGAYDLFQYLRNKRQRDPSVEFNIFVLFGIVFSMSGFFWFIITYPVDNGNTIKTTYIIQVFMLLPILAAEFLSRIRAKNGNLYTAIMLAVLVVFLHNLPILITRWWWFTPHFPVFWN